jgi:hypothetical protein
MAIDHALINYDDAGARVRTYAQGVQQDDYYVHAEDGDPKVALPDSVSTNEVRS